MATNYPSNDITVSAQIMHWLEAAGTRDSEDPPVIRGEMSLWRAVVAQAFMDAVNESTHVELQQARYEAIQWLTGNHPNLARVCDYAGLEPEFVRRMAKRALKLRPRFRNLPGQGRRKRTRGLRKQPIPAQPELAEPAQLLVA